MSEINSIDSPGIIEDRNIFSYESCPKYKETDIVEEEALTKVQPETLEDNIKNFSEDLGSEEINAFKDQNLLDFQNLINGKVEDTSIFSEVQQSSSSNAKKQQPLVIKPVKWTEKEDKSLFFAIKKHGEVWNLVSKEVNNRTGLECQQRWIKLTTPKEKKSKFNDKPSLKTAIPVENSTPQQQTINSTEDLFEHNSNEVKFSNHISKVNSPSNIMNIFSKGFDISRLTSQEAMQMSTAFLNYAIELGKAENAQNEQNPNSLATSSNMLNFNEFVNIIKEAAIEPGNRSASAAAQSSTNYDGASYATPSSNSQVVSYMSTPLPGFNGSDVDQSLFQSLDTNSTVPLQAAEGLPPSTFEGINLADYFDGSGINIEKNIYKSHIKDRSRYEEFRRWKVSEPEPNLPEFDEDGSDHDFNEQLPKYIATFKELKEDMGNMEPNKENQVLIEDLGTLLKQFADEELPEELEGDQDYYGKEDNVVPDDFKDRLITQEEIDDLLNDTEIFSSPPPIENEYDNDINSAPNGQLFTTEMLRELRAQMQLNTQLVLQAYSIEVMFGGENSKSAKAWEERALQVGKLHNIGQSKTTTSLYKELDFSGPCLPFISFLMIPAGDLIPIILSYIRTYLRSAIEKFEKKFINLDAPKTTKSSKRRDANLPKDFVPKTRSISILCSRVFAPIFMPTHRPYFVTIKPRERLVYTPAEDRLLTLGLHKFGDDWTTIRCQVLPTRTSKMICNRFNNLKSSRTGHNSIKAYHHQQSSELSPQEARMLLYGIEHYGRRYRLIADRLLPHLPTYKLKGWMRENKGDKQKFIAYENELKVNIDATQRGFKLKRMYLKKALRMVKEQVLESSRKIRKDEREKRYRSMNLRKKRVYRKKQVETNQVVNEEGKELGNDNDDAMTESDTEQATAMDLESLSK